MPESLADAWQPLGTRTAETSVMMATITAETRLYEPVDTPAIRASDSKIPIRSLFGVDLSFSPPLGALGISPADVFSIAAPKAKRQFVSTIEDEGVIVEQTRDKHSFQASNGTTGRWFVLDVSYPLSAEATSAGAEQLPAETHVAVWPTTETFEMAGGTLPLEAPSELDRSVATELTIDPQRDRERIATLVRSIGTTDED
ncbi:hypothetical protein C490_16039 [Natronobacterium gregoryi SP2]|uniref:Uncharacterized protein n=1 Tax=Natronobacterium gregoryi (strain ATCC 43098 / DSM 3393 / CCM 3738 / CIP 104747 / IAM 13177 / JCM 8860 / NBRC 102187 / NCIMB 2189 / SP2) TaxID=797304 RepID=L9XP32_NATGS|nr:hypothetical protein C490_16039 [Natronobacterium gregoryi SP2]